MSALAMRADANAAIGAGHVMRCIALGEAMRRTGGDVVLFTASPLPLVRTSSERRGVTVRPYESPPDAWAALLGWVRENPDAWVVFDSYDLGFDAQHAIRETGARLLVVDDCAAGARFDCDVLLNQSIGAEGLGYRVGPDTRCCFGPAYALLRSEFTRQTPAHRFDTVASRIVVTFGGADAHNQAARIAGILAAAPPPIDATIIGGQAHGAEAGIATADGVRIEWLRATDDMAALLAGADLAICAAGGTCWELAHLGVPALTLVVAANQARVAAGLHDAGIVRNAGWFDAVSDADLASAIDALRRDNARAEMSRRGRALVDGLGADRVVDAMRLASTTRAGVTLRRAQLDDAVQLYRWRGDSDTIRNSIAPPPPSFAEHRRWLETVMRDPRVSLFIACDRERGVPVGSVRLDRRSDEECEISITVDPEHRGRGYSHDLIARGVEVAGHVRIVARVKQTNVPSLRAFRKQGFSGEGDGDLLRLVYDPAAASRGVRS
jgi:UDP-2,4-diacetamido-2,4,6-trideoxy-beta-L-altropyranose hydrolase